MMNVWKVMLALLAIATSGPAWAVDSYRFLHVTIETPWMIFVFLFFLVFAPMILSAILYVRNAMRRDAEDKDARD